MWKNQYKAFFLQFLSQAQEVSIDSCVCPIFMVIKWYYSIA